MKPTWDTAPEWANYLTMDDDGTWFWHNNEPFKSGYYWISYGLTKIARFDDNSWEESLEKRNED